MNALFHRAKHWQLFTVLVGGIIVLELAAMLYMASSLQEATLIHQPPNMSTFFWFFIPMIILGMIMSFGWQWSVGSGLKHKLPRGVRMNFKLYKAFTIVPIVYFVCYITFIFLMFSRMEQAIHSTNPFDFLELIFSMMLGMIVMLPFALFASYCMFYNFYYCAKTLKSIELGREAELGDYIGYFFLFWFNFVGFWIIQPSVNKITTDGWIPPPTPPGYEPSFDPDLTFDQIPEKEYIPPGEKLKTKNHEAFDHDEDFDGLF